MGLGANGVGEKLANIRERVRGYFACPKCHIMAGGAKVREKASDLLADVARCVNWLGKEKQRSRRRSPGLISEKVD